VEDLRLQNRNKNCLTFKNNSTMTELFELSSPRFEYVQVHLTEFSVGQRCKK
jgi:hypothetical protein